VPAQASAAYFHTRPRGSQLAAWASRQSTVIGSRAELEERYGQMERRWPGDEEVPLPEFWGGYLVRPQVIEFWHGRANRMHDRLRFRQVDSAWVMERLAP
jgi:pyridoxamine 5'-phosphate oxidase